MEAVRRAISSSLLSEELRSELSPGFAKKDVAADASLDDRGREGCGRPAPTSNRSFFFGAGLAGEKDNGISLVAGCKAGADFVAVHAGIIMSRRMRSGFSSSGAFSPLVATLVYRNP
jgi:hypothetical protein